MINRLLGKTVFQITDNNLFLCAQSDFDPATHQPKPDSLVLQIERVSDGVIVTEGEWGAALQSIQVVMSRNLYDLELQQPTESHCPYLRAKPDFLNSKDGICAFTQTGVDDHHAHRICVGENWRSCPYYQKTIQ